MDFEQIKIYIFSALAALIALTLHEYCHGYAAYKMGDNTAKNLGRLSLNPVKHLDPIGTICMIFFHVGWAKPVPVNPRNFKNPKKGFAVTALAGPLVNIVIGFFTAGLFLLLLAIFRDVTFTERNFAFNLAQNTVTFLSVFFSVNVGLGIFNLLPIPPFDGSRIVHAVLPPKIYFGIMKYERQIYLGVLAWLFLGDFVAGALRTIPPVASTPWLYTAVGIFSLGNMLSVAISFISGLMLDLWQLIPYLKL